MALEPLPRRIARTAAVALLALGACAVPAEASFVFRQNNSEIMVFQGQRGEDNDVTISYDELANAYDVRDTGTPGLIADFDIGGCHPDPDDRRHATCPARPGDEFQIFLADGDDTLEQSAPRESGICGGTGDDIISGGARSDVIWGEQGDDELSGGGAIDALAGEEACIGSGATAPPGSDVLRGGPGNDSLEAGRGDDELDGGEGDDRLFAYAGHDSLAGGPGSDFLSGDDGDDTLTGGDGRDALCGGHGDDEELGGADADVLGASLTSQRFACDDAGDDLLDGGAGDDELDAGPSTGFFLEHTELPLPGPTAAGNGGDRLVGGAGTDTLTYTGRVSAVSASVNGVPDDGATGEGDDVGADIEQITGGAGDDDLTGGPAAERLDGAAGADVLRGGGGDDVLQGGAVDAAADRVFGDGGRDTLNGGPGPDELDGGADPDVVAGDGGDDAVRGASGGDALEGGPGSDRLDGGEGDDRLEGADRRGVGADGGDALAGGPGDDTLAGAGGDDDLTGGPGADSLSGGEDDDVADYSDARSPVSVTFDGVADDGRAGERDDAGADIEGFRGSRAADTVRGGTLLAGGDGEDYLDGSGGADRLHGGAGGDTLRSRDGAPDRVSCGRGLDLVVADPDDVIASDCELVQPKALSARAGRAIVRPVAGEVAVSHEGASRTAPLLDRISLRLPIRIDAAHGAVEVTVARGDRRAAARLSGAAFTLTRRGRVLGARLGRATTATCAGKPAGTLVHRLRARSSRPLRTRGAGGTALGRGAWITEERCNGTRFRVLAGKVRIHDRLDRRRLTLRAGDRHMARVP